MSTDSRRRFKYYEMQETLFLSWVKLREEFQSAVQEYNERRSAVVSTLDTEADSIKGLFAESMHLQSLIERKKLNLEAEYLGKVEPHAAIPQTAEELLSAASGVLASLAGLPGIKALQ